jgi:hypothetical protein
VADAYVYHLSHISANDVPEGIRYRFSEFCRKITAVEPEADEGAAYATASRLSVDEAVEMAQEIVYMADAVEHP